MDQSSGRSKMEIFLDDTCQVNFPGDVVYGVLCTHELADPDKKPVIEAIGRTLVWKPGSKKEIDECSTFFKDIAQLRPEEDNSDISLNDKYQDFLKIFMFCLVLPNNLPPSHEVPFGFTRYTLKAHYNDQKVSTYFSVNQWVGLEKRNDIVVKRLLFPISLFSCGHQVQIVLNLNQSYYLPGENINVGAIIKNNSWRAVLFSQICLIQTTKYWKSHRILPIKHVRIIQEEKRGYISSGEEQIIITMVNFKKIGLKHKLFIGNWDKSISVNREQCLESLKSNDPPYFITTKEATLEKNIDFTPKYMIYETCIL